MTHSLSMHRRDFLKTLAALSAVSSAGSMAAFAAEGSAINTLIANAFISGPLRPLVEGPSGVTVHDGPFVSSTDNISKLLTPGPSQYDLLAGVSEFSRYPILGAKSGDEKVTPFDLSLVPNAADLTDLAKKDIAERDGQTYLIPIYSGFDMVVYNADVVKSDAADVQSWGLLFSDDFAGRIAWFDAPHQMLMVAGLFLGHQSPETADASDLKAFSDFLISKKKLVRTLWTKPAQVISLFSSNEIAVSYGIIPVRVALQKQGMNVLNNYPKEGLLSWTNGAFIPKRSEQAEAAQKVVNALLSAEYGAALSRETGYLSVSKAAEALLSAEEAEKFGYNVNSGTTKTYSLKYPAEFQRWVEAWGKIKSA